ncbi:T9SS type B sorting domain-containing protein, partial [Tenacibaculum sp. UWU-22]|uniref:T9SS type B sorting domain-containing protein n=1 Tax=Tenacibaculum sp. UWU-22 TaxID=3234187 RepID=UPI0034DB5D11
IYVRVENNTTSCFNDLTDFDLIVNPKPKANPANDLVLCDDDTDGIQTFDLTAQNSTILGTQSSSDFSVTYYTNKADATSGSNKITNPASFTNTTANQQTIYVRVENNTTSCFNDLTDFDLIVNPKPKAEPASDLVLCDDDTDGIQTFDLTAQNSTILGTQSSSDFSVTYYTNKADATSGSNQITNPTSFTNTTANQQTIYVRVENNTTSCFNDLTDFDLIVNPKPKANPASDLVLCDDASDGSNTNGIQNFDLESQTPTVLGNQDPATFQVTYHSSKTDAENGNNLLSSPFTNTIANQQTIYVRVTNKNTGCYTSNTTFNLIVNPIPIANHVDDLQVCDDDSDGSARNGFAQNINLESQTSGILGSQDAASYTVTYHASLADAQNGTNQLTSPFSNTIPYKQRIYIRIVNNKTNCINDISNFDVLINPEPLANSDPSHPVSDLFMCDDLTDLDDTNGIVQNFDLDSQIPDILGVSQDPDDFIVTFHLSKAEASSGTNSLHSPFTNTTAHQQTIYVRVQNKATGCVNDNFSFLVKVNSVPDFEVTSPQYICLNNTPLTLQVENPDGEYTYQWKDANGNNLGTDISQNVFEPGKYTVTATTTNGSECSKTKTITVNQSNIATLTLDDIIVKDGNDNNTISINNDNHNLGEGDYEFSLLDTNGIILVDYQDSPIFENLEGNIYTVLARDKNGCGVARIDVSVIEFPNFFTPNDDGYNDTWQIKGVNSSFYPKSEIYIFNRLGKVLTKLDIDGDGWDGMYKNKQVSSNDYWFKATLTDKKGNVHIKTGHFSLIRK